MWNKRKEEKLQELLKEKEYYTKQKEVIIKVLHHLIEKVSNDVNDITFNFENTGFVNHPDERTLRKRVIIEYDDYE